MPRISLRSKSDPVKKQFARRMRKNPTEAEKVLWEALRRKQTGFRFCRQYVIRGYIADFYCPQAKLVVEVDGSSHNGKDTWDDRRDKVLASLFVHTLRFSNEQVLQSTGEVIVRITEECQSRHGRTVTSYKREREAREGKDAA